MNRRPYAESWRSGFIMGGRWSSGGMLGGFSLAAKLLTDVSFIFMLVPKKTEGVLDGRSHDQIVFAYR